MTLTPRQPAESDLIAPLTPNTRPLNPSDLIAPLTPNTRPTPSSNQFVAGSPQARLSPQPSVNQASVNQLNADPLQLTPSRMPIIPVLKPATEQLNQPTDQSLNQPDNNSPTEQSTKQSKRNESITNHPFASNRGKPSLSHIDLPILQSINQPVVQTHTQSNDQSNNQSSNQNNDTKPIRARRGPSVDVNTAALKTIGDHSATHSTSNSSFTSPVHSHAAINQSNNQTTDIPSPQKTTFADAQATNQATIKSNPSPFLTASYFSILFLHLLNPLLTLGRKRTLQLGDIWDSVPADRPQAVHASFDKYWQEEVQRYELAIKESNNQSNNQSDKSSIPLPSVFYALRKAFGWRMYIMLLLEFGYYGFYATIPFSMRALVDFIYAADKPIEQCTFHGIECGWWYAGGMSLAIWASSICINHKFYHSYRAGSTMRSALMTAIYVKSLRLSSSARAQSTTGECINLMSNDCSRVFDAATFFNTLFVAPIVIVVALALLVWQIGVAAVAAVALMLIVIPYQIWTAKKTSGYRKQMLQSTDSRVKFINEILQGIRVIKLYEWTKPIAERIATMRQSELNFLQPALLLKALNLGILFVYPAMVTFVTFVLYACLGNEVIPSNVFIVMTFLTLIRFPVSLLPQAITFVSEARVGLQRIQRFLMLEELHSLVAKEANPDANSSYPKGSIIVENGEFYWAKDNVAPVLANINLDIKPGQLVGVIGSVGSGKSSLLAAILGEMECAKQTKVTVSGHVSFMHQKAWIRNQTVQDNILFGLPMDRNRYDECIEAAALLPDLAIMPGGDQTEIGEQGLNMSGGQKARMSMARALYRRSLTDIFMFDDPFSAVDMHVGKHMFDRAVQSALKGKTRIIVLNSHLHFLEQFDRIIVVDRHECDTGNVKAGGRIVACGPYEEISARFPELLRVIEQEAEKEESKTKDDDVPEEKHVVFDPSHEVPGGFGAGEDVQPYIHRVSSASDVNERGNAVPESSTDREDSSHAVQQSINQSITQSPAENSTLDRTRELDEDDDAEARDQVPEMIKTIETKIIDPVKKTEAPTSLMSAESNSSGSIKATVYLDYFRAAGTRSGLAVLVLIMFTYIAGQVTRMMSDYWLVRWGADNNSPPAAHGRDYWIGTWAAFLGSALSMALSRAWIYTRINIESSKNLHNDMFKKLLHAPVNLYFDLTPAGRILNRFSKDLEQIDTLLPGFLHEFILYALQLVGTIILACVVTVYFIPIIVPVLIFFVWIQTFFRATSRELKRLEGSTRSPIFSSFGETLQGLSTIRAYGMTADFITENQRLVDANSKVFLMGYLTERWLSIRLECCACIVVTSVALLVNGIRGTIDPTLGGLTLQYALQMCGMLQWVVRLSIQTENTMTAVERLTSFNDLPQEAAFYTGVTPAEWPQKGAITFRDAKLRYRPELDTVMKGITCTINAGEKIGICGRTGSGKSTLMVALFRLVELCSGAIEIDGVDISSVGLAELRSKLSIIPQDSVLFSGTVRHNLDPFGYHADLALWQALERVGLESAIRQLPGGLDGAVSEAGDNFSHGQKQLICIARALLRHTKILILDEATASIDPASDRALQSTIATNFADCTVLTIAHRLNTIVEYDRIMVLREGVIAEFDAPSRLLRDRNSMFYSMVHEGGDALVEQFIQIADEADAKRQREKHTKQVLQKLDQLKTNDPQNNPTNISSEVEMVRPGLAPMSSRSAWSDDGAVETV